MNNDLNLENSAQTIQLPVPDISNIEIIVRKSDIDIPYFIIKNISEGEEEGDETNFRLFEPYYLYYGVFLMEYNFEYLDEILREPCKEDPEHTVWEYLCIAWKRLGNDLTNWKDPSEYPQPNYKECDAKGEDLDNLDIDTMNKYSVFKEVDREQISTFVKIPEYTEVDFIVRESDSDIPYFVMITTDSEEKEEYEFELFNPYLISWNRLQEKWQYEAINEALKQPSEQDPNYTNWEYVCLEWKRLGNDLTNWKDPSEYLQPNYGECKVKRNK